MRAGFPVSRLIRLVLLLALISPWANADLVNPQLFFADFETTPTDAVFNATIFSPLSSASCSSLIRLSQAAALNFSAQGNTFFFGPFDLTGGATVSFAAADCLASNLTLSYLSQSSWIDVPLVVLPIGTTFVSWFFPPLDRALPGTYLRLATPSTPPSSILVDDLAVDCSPQSCQTLPTHTTYQLAYEAALSEPDSQGGQLLNSTDIDSLPGCLVDGSQSLLFRQNNTDRFKNITVDLASGGLLTFDLFISQGSVTSTCNTTELVNFYFYNPSTVLNTNGSCLYSTVETNDSAPPANPTWSKAVWINEVVHRYGVDYTQVGIDWVPLGTSDPDDDVWSTTTIDGAID